MSGVVNKVIIDRFQPRDDNGVHAKSDTHRKLNSQVLDYFKNYTSSLKEQGDGQPRFFYLTLTIDEKTLRSVKPHNRNTFIEKVYDQVWWRMHDKLRIKRPLTTKTHQHLLMRQYWVIENVNRFGNETLEHLHIVCGVHPKFENKLTKLYWESVIDIPNGFLFEDESKVFYYGDCINDLHIAEIPIHWRTKQKWSDLEYIIDYTNKGATRIENGEVVKGEIYGNHEPTNPRTITREYSNERQCA